MTRSALIVLLVLVTLTVFPASSSAQGPQCDGLMEALANIPPDSPGYSKVIEKAQENCGQALDLAALTDLYYSTDGAEWYRSEGWMDPGVPHCDWYQVLCDDTGRVRSVLLEGNQLSGPIPGSIGNLASLVDLLLDHNQLSGEPLPWS